MKKISRIINIIVSIWHKNMLGNLSLDTICSLKLAVFLELGPQKTVRFSEQIMSADKYPSIFLCQIEAIVYMYIMQSSVIILLIFNTMNSTVYVIKKKNCLALQSLKKVLKILTRPNPGLKSWTIVVKGLIK